jgi:membrane protein
VLRGESVRLRAMALTYISLFALVPALVVAFSVVQAFTGMERIADLVHEFLLDNLAVGARASLEPYLEKFVGNAHAASAGVVGAALLVWSMVSLFSNVDRAVNDIWGIRRRRKLRQQAITYWVGLTLGPLLLAGSLYLGHAVRSWLAGTGLGVLAAAGGALLTCTFFATIYVILPETKVRLGAALGAGLVAGLAWEAAKWGYAIAVSRFLRYQLIYGAVAVIPTFLIWLEVSWTILLFGARVAFVLQYAPALWRGGPLGTSAPSREVLAGRLLVAVGLAFDRNAGPPDTVALARIVEAPAGDVSEALEAMRTFGLLSALASGGLVPSRPLEQINLLDVHRAVLGERSGAAGPPRGPLDRALASAAALADERLESTTLRALCDEEQGRQRLAQEAAPRPSGDRISGVAKDP